MRKESVGGYVREIRDKHITMSVDITRDGAEDFGNVVVVHYRYAGVNTYPDGHTEGKGEQSRVTYTWMRDGDKWVIIGGMCGALLTGF